MELFHEVATEFEDTGMILVFLSMSAVALYMYLGIIY